MYKYVILLVFIVVLIYLKNIFKKVKHPNVKNINAEEAKRLLEDNKQVFVLDVRTKEEYLRGHIEKAKLISVSELDHRVNIIKNYKNKPVLVYCASGGRSPRAVKVLLDNDFTEIYHLYKGLNSWKYTKVK
ncbi:Rhodanese-related sulfurtransferase [Clostridium amylolyticum]|uniref:Rhodanese-related sulfurtransferase n=1 Tax=Clostridium amylolyticum TaxID=1121298 RepID=A0A1M6CT97_9CLOT|nr:rhodanese-like domain-containing protein [Clostridium amylolyticum]SHI63958.1 Rhodanese-related sulfurtransferase [Clostridium amylolyticum]